MKCQSCKADVAKTDKFCHSCGTKLVFPPECSECGILLPLGAKFCSQCGARVQQEPEPASSAKQKAQKQQLPAKPPEIRPPTALESERKQVTIMFADISGFTALSEELDPEEIRDLMNSCFERLVLIVHRYEGYVDKFIGDCIMALFGAPIAHENDQERAVRCAIDMLRELEHFNDLTKSLHPLGMSIGINAGIVVAGALGSAQKQQYTVMGDTVNLAQRLQDLAERGEILVGEAVYKATFTQFTYMQKPPIKVKGKKNPVHPYAVLGERKESSESAEFTIPRRVFLGRERELAKAGKLFQKTATASEGYFVVIGGEAGIGKSRLAEKFAEDCIEEQHWLIFRGNCVSHGTDTAYYPLLGILKGFLNMQEKDSDVDLKGKLETLRHYGLDLNEIHLIGNMLSLYYEASNIHFYNDQLKKELTFQALRKLFWSVADHFKLLIFFDDAHWIDKLSLEFLAFFLPSLPRRGIVVLLTNRSTSVEGLPDFSFAVQFALGPLQKAETFQLVAEVLEQKDLSKDFLDKVWESSGGNPLFVEELLKSMLETGILRRDPETGAISVLFHRANQVEIPQNIHGLLAARIDRLPTSVKRTLQLLSVIGQTFSAMIATAVASDEVELDESLRILIDKDMLTKTKQGKEITYAFRSSLLKEVTYQGILKRHLKELHLRVGMQAELLYQGRPEEHYEYLAYQFQQTDATDKKLYYCERAGDKLSQDFQLEVANQYYQGCVDLLDTGSPDNTGIDNNTRIIDVLFKQIRNHNKLGAIEAGSQALAKAFPLLASRQKSLHHCTALYWQGKLFYDSSEFEEARRVLIEAREMAAQQGYTELLLDVKTFLGATYERLGDSSASFKELEDAMQLAQSTNNAATMGELSLRFGTTALFKGDYDRAKDYYMQALQITKDANLKHFTMKALGNVGIVYGYKGNFVKALEYYKRALDLAIEVGDKIGIARNLHNMGELFFEMEDDEQAYSYFSKSLPISKDIGWREGYVTNAMFVGYLTWKLFKEHAGFRQLFKAVRKAVHYRLKRSVPQGKLLLGKVYLDDKRFAKADKTLQEALHIASETGFQKIVDEIAVVRKDECWSEWQRQ